MMTAYLCQPEVWIPPCWSGTDWLFQKLMNQVRTLKVVEAKMWEQNFDCFFCMLFWFLDQIYLNFLF